MAVAVGDFPLLCEGCLGRNPYIKMQRTTLGGTCKMCTKGFELFKWRPGQGESYKKTEICRTCAEMKNVCQTCLLDLRFGLPSQLRDAVLSYADLADNSHGSTRESDVSRDYKIQEYLKNNNEDTDRSESDNRILKLARAITQNREQHRVVVGAPSSSSSTFNGTQNSIDSSSPGPKLQEHNKTADVPTIELDENQLMKTAAVVMDAVITANKDKENKNKKRKAVPSGSLPPRPPGPPPSWAFQPLEKS